LWPLGHLSATGAEEWTRGADGRSRTDDLLITSQLLYLLSYIGRRHRAPAGAPFVFQRNDLWNPCVSVRKARPSPPTQKGADPERDEAAFDNIGRPDCQQKRRAEGGYRTSPSLRESSNRATPVATETFRDSTPGAIGMRTSRSHVRRTSGRSPSPSPPSTRATLPGGSSSNTLRDASARRPTSQSPRVFSSFMARTRFGTRAM